jgi:hypothetical protein
MLDTIFGLPTHPLIVHATEVVVPTAALVLLVAALWPRFRRWAKLLPLGLALVALGLVPLSTESGEALQERVPGNALIHTHTDLAEGLLPWVVGMVVVAALLLWWNRPRGSAKRPAKWVAVVIAVAALGVSSGTTVQAVLIGHSGATAVWSEVAVNSD